MPYFLTINRLARSSRSTIVAVCSARRSEERRVPFRGEVQGRNKQWRWKIMNRIAYINSRRVLRHIVRFICMRQPRSRRERSWTHTRQKKRANKTRATRPRRAPTPQRSAFHLLGASYRHPHRTSHDDAPVHLAITPSSSRVPHTLPPPSSPPSPLPRRAGRNARMQLARGEGSEGMPSPRGQMG